MTIHCCNLATLGTYMSGTESCNWWFSAIWVRAASTESILTWWVHQLHPRVVIKCLVCLFIRQQYSRYLSHLLLCGCIISRRVFKYHGLHPGLPEAFVQSNSIFVIFILNTWFFNVEWLFNAVFGSWFCIEIWWGGGRKWIFCFNFIRFSLRLSLSTWILKANW